MDANETGSQKKGKKTFKISNMERLDNKELDKVIHEDWASCVYHTAELQENDYAKELGHHKILEPIIINLQVSEIEGNKSDDHNNDDSSGEGDDDNN